MRTKVQQWGNSLALRIPKSFAAELGLKPEARVDLRLEDGKLWLEPVKQLVYRLEDLVEAITEENLHAEQDFGPAVGREVW
jgi:antitoxin MazE